MNRNDQFSANQQRMIKLQTLLDQIEYAMLGESAESKTLYEDVHAEVKRQLVELNEQQKEIAKAELKRDNR